MNNRPPPPVSRKEESQARQESTSGNCPGQAPRNAGRFEWERALRDHHRMAPTALLTCLVLGTYMNKHGSARVTGKTLARVTGRHRSTVHRALRDAIAAGWLVRAQRGGHGRATRYQATVPIAVLPAATQETAPDQVVSRQHTGCVAPDATPSPMNTMAPGRVHPDWVIDFVDWLLDSLTLERPQVGAALREQQSEVIDLLAPLLEAGWEPERLALGLGRRHPRGRWPDQIEKPFGFLRSRVSLLQALSPHDVVSDTALDHWRQQRSEADGEAAAPSPAQETEPAAEQPRSPAGHASAPDRVRLGGLAVAMSLHPDERAGLEAACASHDAPNGDPQNVPPTLWRASEDPAREVVGA